MSEEPHSACLSRHIDVDKLDRLKTSATETYNYDADGNRVSKRSLEEAKRIPGTSLHHLDHRESP